MIGPNALSIELIKPTGERSTANLVPRSHSVFLRLFIQLRGSYLLSYLYLQFKNDSFYIFQSMRDGCIRRLLATNDFSEMKIFSAIEIA